MQSLIIRITLIIKIYKKIIFNFIFLFYSYVFNGRVLDSDDNLYNTVYSSYGLKKKALNFLKIRTENNLLESFIKLEKNEWELSLELLYNLVPYKFSIEKKYILNVYTLDFLTTYRGWRHYRGLPVRGQRTWSNAWSVYNSNWTMRNFKLALAKKNYGNIPMRDIKVASIAEHVNSTWKDQWSLEWYLAKASRLRYQGNKNLIKIDIYAMSNYQIMHPLKLKNLSKKQKQSFKKNYFSLGFDPGFTKPLLMELYNIAYLETGDINNKYVTGSSLILKDNKSNKKNSPKKKAELNKKVKKKIKKSVWD